MSQAGGVLLVEALRASGLDRALSDALAPWRKPLASYNPGKIVTDLAVTLALGGDCLADLALLRAEPGVFGLVASDPTVSRLLETLAVDGQAALTAIDAVRASARARVWERAGGHGPDAGRSPARPLVVDVDATLVTAHSEKEQAAPTFKRGFGFHPLWAFADHGQAGTGEPLAVLLRPGNAGSNTASDPITVLKAAFAQLPGHALGRQPGRGVLVRIASASATHRTIEWLTAQRVQYSVGFGLPADIAWVLTLIPDHVWAPAIDAEGHVRDGAWVAEVLAALWAADRPLTPGDVTDALGDELAYNTVQTILVPPAHLEGGAPRMDRPRARLYPGPGRARAGRRPDAGHAGQGRGPCHGAEPLSGHAHPGGPATLAQLLRRDGRRGADVPPPNVVDETV